MLSKISDYAIIKHIMKKTDEQNSVQIDEKFLKPYEPKETEGAIYKKWLDSGFFNPDVCIEKGIINKDAEKFSIVLPPPNVTGILHVGHASMLGIEDIMVRFERMRGKKTLWLPGTDHAAIATQSKVEKLLVKEEKKNRHDLGREEFLKRVQQFAQDSHNTIVEQVKKWGHLSTGVVKHLLWMKSVILPYAPPSNKCTTMV